MCAPAPCRAGSSKHRTSSRRHVVADELSKGDHVSWKSHGSQAEGTVERKITEDTEASGRTVRASDEDPQYEVKSEKSGNTAVHKPSALHKD
jgi:DUF2945 family protein